MPKQKLGIGKLYRIVKIGEHDCCYKDRKEYERKIVKLLGLGSTSKEHVQRYGKEYAGFVGCQVRFANGHSFVFHQVRLEEIKS